MRLTLSALNILTGMSEKINETAHMLKIRHVLKCLSGPQPEHSACEMGCVLIVGKSQ